MDWGRGNSTAVMRVDSALETSTNTSASIQCLVIHSSIFGFISIPGLCPQGVGGGGGGKGGRGNVEMEGVVIF